MRPAIVFASILAVAAAGLLPAVPAMADNVSIGIRTDGLSLGINIGEPPKLVVVPGTPVYHAPGVAYNYFFFVGARTTATLDGDVRQRPDQNVTDVLAI